ncbi:MAG: PAS domain S-box protein [Thermodesulfobacteriota bacterium]
MSKKLDNLSPDSYEIRIKSAQIQQLYHQSRPGLLGALISAFILVAALRDEVPYASLLGWLVAYLLVQLVRYFLVIGFDRAKPQAGATLPWGRWFAITTALSGLLWGISGLALFPADSLTHQFLLAVFVAGIGSSAAVVYSPTKECLFPTVLATLLPLAARYLYVGEEVQVTIGCVIVLFALALLLTGRRMNLANTNSLRLGFENSDLVASLSEEKQKSDLLNENLRARIEEGERAADALKESEERYRQLVEVSPFGFGIAVDGIVAFVNQAGARLLGAASPQQLVGKPILEFVHPDDLPAAMQRVLLVLTEGKVAPLREEKFVRLDGQTVHVEVTAMPFTYKGQRAVQAVFGNIDERKQAQDALQQSEQRLELALEAAGLGLWDLNMQTGNLVTNRIWNEITGYLPGETPTVIRSWKELIHPDDWSLVREAMVANLRGESALYDTEFRLLTGTGEFKWILSRARVVERNQDGRAVRFVGVIQDITDRKLAEEKIRTALEEKEILLRELHHRVKNNLQVVSSLLRLQSRHIGDEHSLEMLKETQSRVVSMALVHEVLYQSKNLERIEVSRYIQHLVRSLFNLYGAGRDRIMLNIDVARIYCGIDTAIPFGLIVNELVTNALKHAFPGDRTGEVLVGLRAVGPEEYLLAVRDDGVGVPETVDFRNSPSLGLRLVITFVSQLRGQIELNRDHGTEFLIRFREVTSNRRRDFDA